MARAAIVQAEIQQHVAAQIGRLLSGLGASSSDQFGLLPPTKGLNSPDLGLTTTFEVWSLSLASIFASHVVLRDVAEYQQRWHHQLITDGVAVGFARSKSASGLELGELTELFESELASAIEYAIGVIDQKIHDDATMVRLLQVPELYVTALWLVDDVPAKDLCIPVAGFETDFNASGILMGADEFLVRLRKSPQAVEILKGGGQMRAPDLPDKN